MTLLRLSADYVRMERRPSESFMCPISRGIFPPNGLIKNRIDLSVFVLSEEQKS